MIAAALALVTYGSAAVAAWCLGRLAASRLIAAVEYLTRRNA